MAGRKSTTGLWMDNIGKSMKFIVSGNAGFIGSHLADELLKQGEVFGIDDMSTGKWENVNVKVNGAVIDINNLIDIHFKPDVIYHCAARASIPDSITNPFGSNNQNVGGILRVLEMARKTGAVVVFSSSSSVYGNASIPTRENNPPNPMSPYALQKLIGEWYCELYWKLYGVKSVALRYFNVFGERQETANGGYCLVLAKFIDQYKNKKPFTIVGTGEQRRDFVYVGDVVEANLKAAEFAKTANGFEVFNIGSGKNYSVNELADMINQTHPREQLPPRIEPLEMLADISKAERALNWSPKIELKNWIKSLI